MDLENIMLSEISQKRQILYDITYTKKLKNNINEFTDKTETDSQT